MQTKSNIQLIMEMVDIKNKFTKNLQNLCESYKINDNIFVYNRGTYELTKGYFVPVNEGGINDIKNLVDNMDITTQGIRIMGDRIQVGTVYNKIPVDKNFIEINEI